MNSEVMRNLTSIVTGAIKGEVLSLEDVSSIKDALADNPGDYFTTGLPIEVIENYQNDDEYSDSYLTEELGFSPNNISDSDRADYVRARVFSDIADPDPDFAPAFMCLELELPNQAHAYIFYTVTGHSFSGIEVELFGIYSEVDQFRSAARGRYLLDDEIAKPEDLITQLPDSFVLQNWERELDKNAHKLDTGEDALRSRYRSMMATEITLGKSEDTDD